MHHYYFFSNKMRQWKLLQVGILLLLSLVLISTTSAYDDTVASVTVARQRRTNPVYSCPEDAIEFCVDIPSDSTVLLATSKKKGELLLLHKVVYPLNYDKEGREKPRIVPVGRSYDGFKWDRVPGPYNRLQYNCSYTTPREAVDSAFVATSDDEDEDVVCSVTLPAVSTGSHYEKYILSRFEHTLSLTQTLARFLERVTFGTTRKELGQLKNNATANNNDIYQTFADWINSQIEDIPPTYHRSFFRRHVSPRYDSRKPRLEGRITHPCEVGARWRYAAFSLQDLQKDLVISKIDSSTSSGKNKYVLSVNGHPRTVVEDIIFKAEADGDFEISEDASSSTHKICAGSAAIVSSGMGIRYNNYCPRLKNGIPPVDISDLQQNPQYILDGLDPNSLAFTIQNHTNSNDENWRIELMRSTKDLFEEFPDFCSMEFDNDTPIFARLTNGQTMMFDSMLKLENNDLDHPLQTLANYDDNNNNNDLYSKCPNVPRSFLNDYHCQLTTVPICNPERVLDLSLELNEENIKRLNELTGRYYYIIEGLRLGENSSSGKEEDLPCKESVLSRWVKVSSDPNCVSDTKDKTSGTLHYVCIKKHLT